MTNETVEIIDAIVEEPVTPIAKIKTALKKVDTKVYIAAAAAVAGAAVGFAAYKRIDNFENREAERLLEAETIDIVTEV